MSEQAMNPDNGRDRQAPLLELRGITKSYGHVRALEAVSFVIRPGETVGLLGDNGAGKSTLVKIVSGVVRPDGGTMLWQGKPVRMDSRAASTALGIEPIFQDGALCDAMPIWRNMFLGREHHSRGILRVRKMRSQSTAMLRDVMEISGVHPDRLVGELSGGQRQAVAIARAVHFKRTLLLLDEPTSALGARETEDVLAYVRRLKGDRVSSAFITHNLYHAYQVCDRFIVMSHGRVVLDAPRADISLDELTKCVIAQ